MAAGFWCLVRGRGGLILTVWSWHGHGHGGSGRGSSAGSGVVGCAGHCGAGGCSRCCGRGVWCGAAARGGKLPAHVTAYLTMALCLFWQDDYEEVATKVTGSPDRWGWMNHDLKLFAACQRAGVHVAKDVEAPVTDAVDFAAFLNMPLDAITSKNDDLSLPAAALSGADVERLVERGQAQRMFTDEPTGPVLVDQHWYAVEEGSTDGLLRPVSAEHASQLDA